MLYRSPMVGISQQGLSTQQAIHLAPTANPCKRIELPPGAHFPCVQKPKSDWFLNTSISCVTQAEGPTERKGEDIRRHLVTTDRGTVAC